MATSRSKSSTCFGGFARTQVGPNSVDRAHDYNKPYTVAYKNIIRQRNLRKVDELFLATDADGSGNISVDEWYLAMRQPSAQATFKALGMQPHQAGAIFRAFDQNEDGQLSHAEFMIGLHKLLDPDDDGNSRDIGLDMLRAANLKMHEPIEEEDTNRPNCLPQVKLQRAFVHSAIAQALNPAAASKKGGGRRIIGPTR